MRQGSLLDVLVVHSTARDWHPETHRIGLSHNFRWEGSLERAPHGASPPRLRSHQTALVRAAPRRLRVCSATGACSNRALVSPGANSLTH